MRGEDIIFEPEAHVYRRPDGVVVPGVTHILRSTGISADFEAIKSMGAERAAAVDLKRDIGSALHADTHAYDDGDLVMETVHPLVLPYLKAWMTFRDDKGLKPLVRERLVYHHGLNYAGTMDGLFETPSGKVVLPDLKTGDPEDSGCRFQTAAYYLAYMSENPGVVIHERWAVQLTPDTKGCPYRVTSYLDWTDFDNWKAIVATFYLQPANRRAA